MSRLSKAKNVRNADLRLLGYLEGVRDERIREHRKKLADVRGGV